MRNQSGKVKRFCTVMGNKMDDTIATDVLIAPSDWDCFGIDDCSSAIMGSCWKDNPVLCLGCSVAARAEASKRYINCSMILFHGKYGAF